MPSDRDYKSNLAEFVDKAIKRWDSDKKKILVPKLRRNFEAVTNSDYRTRKWKKDEGKDWRSNSWVGFVRVKIWSFFAVMVDTFLRAGKVPFVLNPSKYDEQYMNPDQLKERDARIEKMTSKIESQLTMRHADREKIKEILSGGYYGMAFSAFNIEEVDSIEFKQVLPGEISSAVAAGFMDPDEIQQYARYKMVKDKEDVPGHRYVSVWNMVWDMDSDDLQPATSDGYAEHMKASPFQLKQLNGVGYISANIGKVISEAKDNKDSTNNSDTDESPGKASLSDRTKTIDRYAFYMRVPRIHAEDFERIMAAGGDDVFTLNSVSDVTDAEESGDDIEIMGEIAGGEIIRYLRNDTGKRPHKMWVVEQNLDETTGTGIADNMESVQESLVGMIRSFEDNKKLSANVITAVKNRYFNDPSQVKSIKPGTQLDIADSCDDARKAIMPIVIPDVGESLMSGIQLMMQLKDDVSMIPTILQGFNLPKHQPDTAYEMQQLTINAGKYIGMAIRNMDEMMVEDEIKDIYEYNMLYGDDEECKVNCKVKANGFTSFQNKEVRGARMQQILGLMASSEFLSPWIKVRPHLDILYEANDEDPTRFVNSEEEMAQDAQRKMEAEAMAQQRAIQMAVQTSRIEAGKEIMVKDREHQHTLSEEDQKHEHRLIEDGVKSKVSSMNKPKDSQRGAGL